MPRPWQRPRAPEPPELWQVFCEHLVHVSPDLARRWWRALAQARWSRPMALRMVILTHDVVDTQREPIAHLYRVLMRPRVVLEALEDVVRERLLSRHDATRIADAILTLTDRDGAWQGAADDAGPTPSPDINAQVYAVLDRV